MTLLELRNLARSLTYSTAGQVDDPTLNLYINIIYKTLVEEIHQDVREDYMADIFTDDLVVGKKEYTLSSPGSVGIANVTGVTINYREGGVDNLKTLRPEKISNLERDISYYETSQSKSDPFYIIYDTGIRIYPLPTEAVTGGIVIYGTKAVTDLTLDADTPLIDPTWQYVIAIGAKQYIFAQRGQFDKQTAAINEYIVEKKKMINNLTDRDLSPIERLSPNTTKYE